MARALMPRQPYSAAVKSDGEERLHPLSPEGKRAWEKRWNPPYEGGTGWLEELPYEGKPLWLKTPFREGDRGVKKTICLKVLAWRAENDKN